MRIILDTNILFSALIKDSTTRRLILEFEGTFLFPEFIFEEANKHKEEIVRKSGLSHEEFSKLFLLILRKVMIIPSYVLEPYRQEAQKIMNLIDENDVLFVACALAFPESIIWSNDSHLKEQHKIMVITTTEAMELI